MLARARLIVGTVGVVALVGCGDSTSPEAAGSACTPTSALRLSPNEGRIVTCGTTTLVTLAAGAKYLIVPQFASGGLSSGIANAPVAYQIGVPSSATSQITPVDGGVSRLRTQFAEPPASTLQQRFDSTLRDRARTLVHSGEPFVARGASSPRSAQLKSAVPELGTTRDFRVLAGSGIQTQATGTATARLSYVGANVLLYIDTLAPKNGFTPAQLQSFGRYFDQTLYSIVVSAFGPPTDIDANGHIIVLLSPSVNRLSPTATCDTQGFVAGYFNGADLSSTGSTSNRGEIFYAVVPDPVGTVSCAHTVAGLLSAVPATFLHELQHLVSFSQHVVIAGGNPEEGWLDEGLSIRAEELGSEYFEAKYPPPTGRSSPSQLFPDSSQGFVTNLLSDSYSYLLKPDTASLTLHTDAEGGFSWRGADWLFVHWLGDLKGKAVFTGLEQTRNTGLANVASVSGESFASLFGDFSLALWTDSIVGVPRSAIPSRNRFQSRNLRQMYQRVFETNGSAPRVFPLLPTSLSATTALSGTMVPGTAAYYVLDLTAVSEDVVVKFSAPGGVAFSSKLNPQISVYRLP